MPNANRAKTQQAERIGRAHYKSLKMDSWLETDYFLKNCNVFAIFMVFA